MCIGEYCLGIGFKLGRGFSQSLVSVCGYTVFVDSDSWFKTSMNDIAYGDGSVQYSLKFWMDSITNPRSPGSDLSRSLSVSLNLQTGMCSVDGKWVTLPTKGQVAKQVMLRNRGV